MLETVIDNLNDGIAVSNESKIDPELGYPYATGYSRASMTEAVNDLVTILDQYRTLMIENNQ